MEVDLWLLTERTVYLVLVWPATVAWWRSVWEASPTPVGLKLDHAILAVLVADTALAATRPRPAHPVTGRLLNYLASLIGVIRWKLLWTAGDVILASNAFQNAAVAVASIAAAGAFRVITNIHTLSPIPDSTDVVYTYFPYFRTKEDSPSLIWILDVLFSVIVIGTLVVFVWRGSWTLLDIYLFPEQPEKSAIVSLGLGYLLVVVTFATQPLIKAAVRRSSGLRRLALVDFYLLFSFCSTINVWRGIWQCLNYFFMPDNPDMGYLVTHIGCFLLLVLLNASNSIMVRGVYIDAEEPGDQCVDLPCYYLRLIFQEKRKKKLLKKQAAQIGEATSTLVEGGKKPQIIGRATSELAVAHSLLPDSNSESIP